MKKQLDTVQQRLRYWRTEIAELSRSQLRKEVNEYLEPGEQVASVTTISNYESSTQPRASFLSALMRIDPNLSLVWLIVGSGEPKLSDEDRARELRESVFTKLGKMVAQTRLNSLPVPARTVLLGFYSEVQSLGSRYQSAEALAELAAAVERLLFAPFESVKHFRPLEELSSDDLTRYTVMAITALRPLVRLGSEESDS